MIAFDFAYYRPESIEQAVQTFQNYHERGKEVVYYNGGTEFITFARKNKIKADVIVDLKGISACHVMGQQGDQLTFGSSIPLNQLVESNHFPLLAKTAQKIADHTSRNKITLGGNLNSRLMYREAILPLLLAEAQLKVAGREGEVDLPIQEVFDQKLNLNPCQFIIQASVDRSFAKLPFVSIKRTMRSKVDYPLVSVAAVVKQKKIRAAFSGICAYPFRCSKIEDILNDSAQSVEQKIEQTIMKLPTPIVDDLRGSSDYRAFVFKHVLTDMLETLEWAKK
ncbi:xanthine dehydrogenase [Ammoniphilus oxalaticus]|uniref:Xanthine dehydrogenase n=1 Tax=Ammoniphilus oxalaticus TaxID=66863 RepID=A0A419SLV5_9BACL|nr:FAD binding domain-containing protein [Ammoniphilus oxalaticus]RKD24995.1 xanthine dehydrogenase [Ammoniphilus oxalaticus]